MRIGIITPIVILLPRSHNEWEIDASVDELVAVAEAGRPARLPPPHVQRARRRPRRRGRAARRHATGTRWRRFGYLAARTERIRFATNVLVLGYHHPLEIAKRYGTLDRV